MKNENYIVIQGWFVNGLNLKGNNLLLFSLIYGFCQDGESEFRGSNDYVCKALNCSKNTVIKSQKELVELGLINQRVETVNNVNFNRFSINDKGVQKLNGGGSKSEPEPRSEIERPGGAITEPNNTINNNTNLKDSESCELFKDFVSLDSKILNYLNEKKPSKIPFQLNSKNKKFVVNRIKEKFKFEDFKKVIDFKISEWKDDKKMKQYIRPETLFGSKFESYLIQAQDFVSENDGSNNFELEETSKSDLL